MQPLFSVTAGVALLLAPLATAQAQAPTEQRLAEIELTELLNVRAVTGARHDQRVVDSPRQIGVVTGEEIRRRNYPSTPHALADIVGIFVQETNDGAGAPIIRGLIGNQVLILVDGIRLNNGAYRLGPNQYLNTVDLNQIERIEVLRGAGSVLYGSDALGGVVNIITRPAGHGAGTGPVGTRWFTRLSSANEGAIGRAELSLDGGAAAFVGGLTLKHFGVLRGGRETGAQPFTGYDEWDGDGKVAFALSPRQKLVVAGQRVTQRHIQRADTLTAGIDLQYEWDPQTRGLGYTQYTARDLDGPIKQIDATLSYQEQAEHYGRIAAATADTERVHLDRVRSVGAAVQFSSTVGPRHLLTYGVDTNDDRITSRRQNVSLVTGASTAAKGTYADGSRYRSLAAFVHDDFHVSPRLDVSVGARFSRYHARAVVTDTSTGDVDVNTQPQALTGAMHALFRLSSALDLVGGVGQGFRAPNIDDLTVIGLTGNRFEVPNPHLDPEHSINVEAGVRARSLRATGSATYFFSDIDGLIQREPGLFQGLHFRDQDGNGTKDSREPLIFQRKNAGSGRIDGVELEGRLRLSDRWMLSSMLVRTVGSEQVTGDPLRRIPPTFGRAVLAWSSAGRVWADAYTVFASRQTRLAPGDKTDVRIPAGGTPGFVTLNLRGGFKLTDTLRATLALENLTNRTYRTHGSGFDAAGRGAVLGLDWARR